MRKILRPILTNAHAYNESEPYKKTPPGEDKIQIKKMILQLMSFLI